MFSVLKAKLADENLAPEERAEAEALLAEIEARGALVPLFSDNSDNNDFNA